ncbi:class I SAM-dependent methyltransferase [Roseateles sp.]|uniref:class I SAM-dependent methyltransferase n=1 Tax=Roseateles sp. TaxID=1971397 RepID=UPI0039E88934
MSISQEDALQLKAILARHAREGDHSGYRALPERFNAPLAGTPDESQYRYYERERFAFFTRHVDFSGKRCLDIGCNHGYFLFSLLDAGARQVAGYEGQTTCGEFVETAIAKSRCQDQFSFFNEYYQFGDDPQRYDVGLLLNVLHHLGGVYGPGELGMAEAKREFLDQLNRMSTQVGTLIFQLGFNWKGDPKRGLFPHGTKSEMIDFIRAGTNGHWQIEQIGIAEKGADGRVSYQAPSDRNIARDDSLGEFLNRPLFILRSQRFSAA